jgi:hypothetical protein
MPNTGKTCENDYFSVAANPATSMASEFFTDDVVTRVSCWRAGSALEKNVTDGLNSRWRRTTSQNADDSLESDDWSLVDDQGQTAARLYKVRGGPRDGQWFWTVPVDERDKTRNGASGYCWTGTQTKA